MKTEKKLQKTILIYGLTGMQMLMLDSMAEKLGIVCRPVSDTQTSLTVAQLLSDKEQPQMPPMPLLGKFALLHGFQGNEQIGTALINQAASGVIKAIHTPHNSNWRFSDLCTELQKEHLTMKQG